MANQSENRELELLRSELATVKKVAAGNLELLLENESLRVKLDRALVVLRKADMTPLDRWYASGLHVEVAQILRDNKSASS